MAEKIWRGGIGLRPPPGLRRYWRPSARLTTGISGSTLAQNASEMAQDFILILYQLFADKFLMDGRRFPHPESGEGERRKPERLR